MLNMLIRLEFPELQAQKNEIVENNAKNAKITYELENKILFTLSAAPDTMALLSDDVLIKKFNAKPVDLLVGTKVNNGLIENSLLTGFNVENASYRFTEKGVVSNESNLSKSELAEIILKKINL